MEIKDFKNKIKLDVRFSDLDAMQHVNNAAYLSYLEEGRLAYFNEVLDLPKNSLDFGAVIARIEIDYIRPITMGDKVEVLTRIAKVGNKSSDVESLIVIIKGDRNIIAAKAITKLVSFDFKKSHSVPVSEDVKKRIADFEGLPI